MEMTVNETISELENVYNLLNAMENLNEKEVQTKAGLRTEKIVEQVETQNVKKISNKQWVLMYIGAVIAGVVFVILGSIQNFNLNIIDFSASDYFRLLYLGLLVGVPGATVIFVLFFLVRKMLSSSAEKVNSDNQKYYLRIVEENRRIEDNNRKIESEIVDIHKRKQLISQEYRDSIAPWFPNEYLYKSAIEFFIRELQIGTARTLPEAILNYKEHLHRQKVEDALNGMNTKMNIMISNQERMIFQQMIGNWINYATWQEARKMNQSMDIFKESGKINYTYY